MSLRFGTIIGGVPAISSQLRWKKLLYYTSRCQFLHVWRRNLKDPRGLGFGLVSGCRDGLFWVGNFQAGNIVALSGRKQILSPFIANSLSVHEVLALQGHVNGEGDPVTAGDIVSSWNLELDPGSLTVPVVEPIASLLLCGKWSSIGMLGHWRFPFALFPGFPHAERSKPELEVDQQDQGWSNMLTPAVVSKHAQRLRAWAVPVLESTPDDDERSFLQMELGDTVSWLDALEAQMDWQSRSSRGHRHPSRLLINCVFFRFTLGSAAKVSKAFKLALQVGVPGLDLRSLASSGRLPSKTTLARASTYLDIAYLLYCQKKWGESEHVTFMWADSSPQSGRDWLMSMMTACPRGKIAEACAAANYLCRTRPDWSDHFEALEVDLEMQAKMTKVLSDVLCTHTNVPVALGSGKGKIQDKTAAILHSLAMESPCRSSLRLRLNTIFSWTSDLGTEVLLPSFETLHFEQLLPGWLHAKSDNDVDDVDAESLSGAPREAAPAESDDPEPAPDSAPSTHPLLPRCLIIAGGLHVTHNVVSDLHLKLEWWSDFWTHLQHIVHLLEDRMYRERFIVTCVRGTPAAEYEEQFASLGLEKLYTKRWQVVITCLSKLLPVFTPLQQAWNETKFLEAGDTQTSVAPGVTAALNSNLFCSYIYMIHTLHRLIANLESWLECCTCHQHLLQDVKKLRKGQRKKLAKCIAECPCKGKRAPELACGALKELLSQLDAFVLQGHDQQLTNEERNVLNTDFEYGRSYLRFSLSAKFSFWDRLPWHLAGLAHHWPSQARAAAKACMAQYDDMQANPRMKLEHHHVLSVEFLQPGTALRRDIESFASGEAMTPELAAASAPFRFIAVVERVVEGLHRNVKVASKHVALGPTKISLSVRLREIEEMAEDPAVMSELCKCFEDARQIRIASARLGVLQHPQFLELLYQKRVRTTHWLRTLQHAIHRCDLGTQFMNLDSARAVHNKKRELDKTEAKHVRRTLGLPVPRTFDDILKRLICDHFRGHADASQFYSLPPIAEGGAEAETYELTALEAGMSSRGQEVQRDVLECDIDLEHGDDTGRLGRPVVFRLLHGSPSMMKSAPFPVANKPMFAAGAAVVTLHEVFDEGPGEVSANFGSAGAPQVLQRLEACSLQTLREGLQTWDISSCCYSMPGPDSSRSSVTQLVTALLEAKGIPGEPYVEVPERLQDVGNQLQQRGLLQQVPNRMAAEGSLARLTDVGMASVQTVCVLTNPLPVCRISSDALADYDAMELLLALESSGWQWKPLPTGRAARVALRHTPDSPREWFSMSHVINKQYLLCLLYADELFDKGIQCIPHWTRNPKQVYPRLLKGEQPPSACLEDAPALEPDDAIEDGSAKAVKRRKRSVAERAGVIQELGMWALSTFTTFGAVGLVVL
ncbi:unnamed protein product [Symbiodinium sp. CCMP2456]|nr:unnamed protein product [Symbiodinium sp. CCMP2456]